MFSDSSISCTAPAPIDRIAAINRSSASQRRRQELPREAGVTEIVRALTEESEARAADVQPRAHAIAVLG